MRSFGKNKNNNHSKNNRDLTGAWTLNIRASFQRWRELQDLQGLKSNAELAAFLLDR